MTTVFLVPALVVIIASLFYLYSILQWLLSKTTVQNKVVLITDSLSALGMECAKLFHKGGARLILCGKNYEKLEPLAEQLLNESDPTVTFPPKLIELDFSDMETLPEVISDILDCYGCLDVLLLNSSMKVKAPVQTLSLEMDRIIMDTNYFGPITLAKGILPSMISRRTGHILLVNSIQGKLAVPFRTTYSASKHAVQAFFDCLRAEVQEYGICVSTVNHTFIKASPSPKQRATTESFLSGFPILNSPGICPEKMATELMKTLNNKKNEVTMAHSFSKVAVYTRFLFPNFFFAVTAAGVRNAAAIKQEH